MIRFQREDISPDVIEEIRPLAELHFNEIDPFPEIDPNLSGAFYRLNQEYVRLFTAREGENLVGYAVFAVTKHPHYEESIQATQDLFFVAPEARLHGWVGLKLIRFCDEQLKAEGVEVVYQFSPRRRDIGPLLARAGYHRIQDLYARRLY